MSARFRCCIYIVLQVFIARAYCQSITSVKHYSTADGLSDNRVTCVTKDSEGFMWFGSWSGITRFDGNNFLIFKSHPGDRSSLKSNRIDDIVVDPEDAGCLWVKAYDNQIYRFDKRTQKFSSLTEILGSRSLEKILFTRILAVRNGRVWLKTENAGLVLIFKSEGKFRYIRASKAPAAACKLPSDIISVFHLDKAGDAWVATPGGLRVLKHRQGNTFEVKTIRGLEKESITGIAESKNTVWLGSGRGHLLPVNRMLERREDYKLSDSGLNYISVSNDSSKVYCSTREGSLLSVPENGKPEFLTRVIGRSPLFSVYEDRFSDLWVGSGRYGVVKYSPADKSTRYPLPELKYQLNAEYINLIIFEDKRGTLWINLQGLKAYNREKGIFEAPLNKFEDESERLSVVKYRSYYDPSGVLWLLPYEGGVEKVLFKEHDFRLFLPQVKRTRREDDEIRGLYTDKRNRLWVGTKAGEVWVYNKNTKADNILSNKPRSESGIYAIAEDKAGRIWMGTKANGLVRADPVTPGADKYKITRYLHDPKDAGSISSNSIYCLLSDRKGRLWAGTYGAGLVLIEEKNGKIVFKTRATFKKYPRDICQRVRHLAEDAKGRIWAGTTEGVLIFDPDSGSPENYRFRQYKKEPGDIHSLGGNDVQFIFKDSGNRMWVLTSSGGLNLASGTDPFKSLSFLNYSARDGLPSDFLLSCAEDEQKNLWIATQNGISKFDLQRRKFQNFNYYDGLPEASFSEGSCARMRNGDLFFGTTMGFLGFSPPAIKSERINTKLAFTGIHVNSEELAAGDNSPLRSPVNTAKEVVLNHDQNSVSIEFAVLDYHSMEKQSYACRLLGLDDEWSNTRGQRRATYTKLPPGKYVFEVKCLNEELYRNVPARSLRITILPPPWKTWWAYLIYTVLLIFLLMLIRRIILTVLGLRQKIEIERRVADLKLNFFTQISHELRTPLTLIVNPAEEVLEQENLSDKGREYLNMVVKNSRRMVRLVNHLLDLRKVQSGKASLRMNKVDIVSFLKDIMNYFTEVIRERNLRVEVLSDFPEFIIDVDAEKIDIVFYNLLANAIKFSADNSLITIAVKSGCSGFVRIEVIDEGIGVNGNELKDIFELYYEGSPAPGKPQKGTGIGLALSRGLVELHGGDIYAENNSPRGLKVVVELKSDNSDLYPGEAEQSTAGPVSSSPEISAAQFADADSEKPQILLVEDNDELRSFLGKKLADFYRVETAKDGAEGLEKARELLPDLILSDIMMPVLDGIGLLERIKGDVATSHIPVILLTARYSVESQVMGLNYGADYYITKPFRMELLQAAISNLISRRKSLFRKIVEGTKEELPGPDQPSFSPQDKTFLEKIIAVVEERLDDAEFNIDDVADSIRMSRSGFFKKFKSLTNIAPVEFVRETRLRKAKELFNAGQDNVSSVAYAVGFTNPKYFSTCFKAQYHLTPTEYLKSLKQGV